MIKVDKCDTDILMICKGHYNTVLHESSEDALKAYQRQYATLGDDYELSAENVLKFMWEAIRAFLPVTSYREILDRLGRDMEIHQMSYGKPFEMSTDYLLKTYITALSMCPVRVESTEDGKPGEYLYDFSMYEKRKDGNIKPMVII
jgi:hypothetical protein